MNIITIKNLNFIYENSKKHALKDINFEIKKGEIFGFLIHLIWITILIKIFLKKNIYVDVQSYILQKHKTLLT